MATMEGLKDTLHFLESVLKLNDSQKKQMEYDNDDFFEAYYFVLRNYSEGDIRKGAMRCCDELSFFPTPREIADRIPHRHVDKLSQELVDMYTCQICKEKVSAISDGMCLDCAQVNPQLAMEKKNIKADKRDRFIMQGRRMCQQCKRGPLLCIKEPADSGLWLCQDCYSGLTAEERALRLRDIMKMIKNSKYVPLWTL